MQWGAAADRDVVGEVSRPERANLAPYSKATLLRPPAWTPQPLICTRAHGKGLPLLPPCGERGTTSGHLYCLGSYHLRESILGAKGGSQAYLQASPGAQYWEVMGIKVSSTWMEVREGTGSARRETVGAGRRVTRQDTNEKLPCLSLPGLHSVTHTLV